MDRAALDMLVASTTLPVARINYRAGSPASAFPVPLHDVLAGYERVIDDVVRESRPSGKTTRRPPVSVGVCGQLFGGTLAMSLALTESRRPTRLTSPASILSATAVGNPIVDWTVPERDEEDAAKRLASPSSRSRHKETSWERFGASEALPAASLLALRRRLFSGPDAYMDAFASPVHFFRAPAVDAPRDWPGPGSAAQQPQHHDEAGTAPAAPAAGTATRRKARKIFPPTGSDLELPWLRVTAGEGSVLHAQCAEIVRRAAESRVRACLVGLGMNVGSKTGDDDENPAVREAVRQAREMFVLNSVPGVGLWGVKDDRAWEDDVGAAGRWFQAVVGLD
jgi:hypothetical protein